MASRGETDLATLLAELTPALNPGSFVFCEFADPPTPDELAQAVATFREDEGVTLVLAQTDAVAMNIASDRMSAPMAWITLTVHSSLDAVGLTAAVADRLTREGISCNVIAAFFHDHLFVPVDRAADAMHALRPGAAGDH
jgi:hypothetical protein